VKKILAILAALIVLFFALSCAGEPKPTPPVTTGKFEILENTGTTLGYPSPPAWVEAAIQGPKAVEKLPDYKGLFVVVVDQTGKDLEGTKAAARKLDADTSIASYLSLRVKDTFAGAQVGDKDRIETYMERTVKSVAEARFSGFQPAGEYWVHIRWYKPDKPKVFDHDEYRVVQLYTIDKARLEDQLKKILENAVQDDAKVPEKQRAIDMVQQSFFEGF
jgi:hypothetical protein